MAAKAIGDQAVVLDEQEQEVAASAFRDLANFVRAHPTPSRHVRVVTDNDDSPSEIVLPSEVVRLLIDMLDHMSKGEGVAVVPYHANLTTQQAADFLNVSRPYLIKLLEGREIPFELVGTHRRIKFRDLVQFKRDEQIRREQVMTELTAESQKQGSKY